MENRSGYKKLIASLVAGLFLPVGAQAADEALLQRLEAMQKEIEQLRAMVQTNQAAQAATKQETTELKEKVQRTEDKSLSKWLTIGGDYQFRVDSLRGETKPFTDVTATFANAQNQLQATFFANPTPANGQMLNAFAGFAQGMAGVKTYQQAQQFLGNPQNQQLLAGLSNFAVTVPAYKPHNDTLYTNRFGLDLNAKATQDVSVTARLLMYKTFGSSNDDAVTNSGSAPFFADRVGVFDGTLGHIPSSDFVNVDRAYATWSNIADEDIWFSVGRRPSSHGAPTNLKYDMGRPGNGGTPALLVDYAFDGMTVGWAPDIDGLPGAYGKICYGRGFEAGYSSSNNPLKDTDFVGISIIPIDTDALRVWTQWNRGSNIFDAPVMSNTYFGDTKPKINLGSIDWVGGGAMGTVKNVGRGDLNYFVDLAMSRTHPNDNVSSQFGFQGLLTGAFFSPEAPSDKTGSAIFMGVRYDLPSRTKLGLEFNHGSKNWITFAPASSDTWTAKVGTRGNVYEVYGIQEIDAKAISSYAAKSFFRLGVQYYDFAYTGSNNWVGAPVKISSVNNNLMATTPLSKAVDVYGTFEVKF
jgi:hypothetical protein